MSQVYNTEPPTSGKVGAWCSGCKLRMQAPMCAALKVVL